MVAYANIHVAVALGNLRRITAERWSAWRDHTVQGVGKVFQGDVGSGDTPVMNR